MSLKIVFILANSVGPDEMPYLAAFHLVLHCLHVPKYPFVKVYGFPVYKGLVHVRERSFYVKLNFSGGPSLKLRKMILMRSSLSMMVST